MAVAAYEYHRPREATIAVSLSPDFSGDHIAPGAADNVTINAAITEAVILGIGEVVVLQGGYTLTATVNVPVDLMLRGLGWSTIFNYNAGGNCITITGNNVKIRDLKIVITAGAGGAGTRPNGILADTRTNLEICGVWHVGDQTVADDGSNLRQNGLVLNTVTDSRVENNHLENNRRNGITLQGSSNNAVVGNTCQGNIDQGIFLSGSTDNSVTGNTCQGNIDTGISITTNANNNAITGNTCEGNTVYGIFLSSNSYNSVTGNTCQGNTSHGIRINASLSNAITGNTCQGNSQNGILLGGSANDNVITGNTCQGNTRNGILIDDSDNNTVVGNSCNGNDSGDTGSFDGINITDVSLDNLIHSNTCNDNDRYGINIDDVLALRNWVKNNQLRGNTSGPFNDNIANLTKLVTVPIPLIQGTAFVSTAGEAWGWEIDADTEFALGIGWLPLEVQQVVRIRVIGVGLAAPGAGNFMRIQITGEGATFDEVFTTEPIDVVDKDNEEVNFAIDDVINWVFDATDDADIGDLLGGDRLQIKVLHEGAGNGNIATNAIVDSIQVEIV